jgi:hypothetical protein
LDVEIVEMEHMVSNFEAMLTGLLESFDCLKCQESQAAGDG